MWGKPVLVFFFSLLMTHHTVLSLVLRMQRRIPARLFASTSTSVEPFRKFGNQTLSAGRSSWKPSSSTRLVAPKFASVNRTRHFSSHSSGTFEDDDLDAAFDNVLSSQQPRTDKPREKSTASPSSSSVRTQL